MRTWYKYIISENNYEHTTKTDAYDINEYYKNYEEFYKHYFLEGPERIKVYDNYLKNNIDKESKILSVGSGRCINEIKLINEGYSIECSELEKSEILKEKYLKNICPNIRLSQIDILNMEKNNEYDCILSLSNLFIFDYSDLIKIIYNFRRALKDNGILIFDFGGGADNLWTYLLDEIFLKLESYYWLIKIFLKYNKKYKINKVRHGIRITNKELINLFENNGFQFIDIEEADFNSEYLGRSVVINKIYNKKWKLFNLIINFIRKRTPYVRMFKFKKK